MRTIGLSILLSTVAVTSTAATPAGANTIGVVVALPPPPAPICLPPKCIVLKPPPPPPVPTPTPTPTPTQQASPALGAPQAVDRTNTAICTQAPAVGLDGKSGTCMDGNYLHNCPSQQAACATLLSAQYTKSFTAAASYAGTKNVVLPSSMPHQTSATTTTAPGDVLAATPFTTRVPTIGLRGFGTGVEQTSVEGVLNLSGNAGAPFLAVQNAVSSPRYPLAQKMATCGEYVWKKWYGYSRYEDVSHAAQGDASLIWQRLADFGGDNSTPGIKYNGDFEIAGEQAWLRADGKPITVNPGTTIPYVMEGQTWPRNVFLQYQPDWLSASDPTQAAILAAIQAKVNVPITLAGGATADNDIVWAASNVTGAAGAEPTVYEDAERRMDRYATQLAYLADLRAKIAQTEMAITCAQGTCTTATSLGTNLAQLAINAAGSPVLAPRMGAMNSRTFSTAITIGAPPTATANAYVPGGFDQYLFPSALARRSAASGYLKGALAIPVKSWVAPGTAVFDATDPYMVKAAPVGAGPSLAQLQAELATLNTQVAATKATLTALLVQEWNNDGAHGCLGGYAPATPYKSEVVANHCDWSPHMMVLKYAGLFQKARQQAMDECLRDTGDDFTIVRSQDGSTFHDPNLHKDYSGTLTDIDTFFSDYENRDSLNQTYDAKLAKQQAAWMAATSDLPLQGSASAPSAIGDSSQDQGHVGGDWFGAGYSYSASWSITPTSQPVAGNPGYSQICSLSGTAQTSFEAHAMILKSNTSLIDAAIGVTVNPQQLTLDQGHLSLLGNSMFNADGTNLAQEWNYPIDKTPAEADFSTIIPILGIPIEVGAGAGLHLGATFDASARKPPQCDPKNLTFSLHGGFTPYASADAHAWASVDLLIVSAGIEGHVSLLTANVPVTTDVQLGLDANNQFNLVVNNNGSLTLTELSGYLDLYAEVNLVFWSDRAQINFLPWDGFHQEYELWNLTKSYPLPAVQYRMFQKTDPTAVP